MYFFFNAYLIPANYSSLLSWKYTQSSLAAYNETSTLLNRTQVKNARFAERRLFFRLKFHTTSWLTVLQIRHKPRWFANTLALLLEADLYESGKIKRLLGGVSIYPVI